MLGILLLSVLYVFAFRKSIISINIPPQAFFMKKIVKNSVEINILMSPNSDEYTMEFKSQALKKLGQSEIYFLADLELEKILERKLKDVLKSVKIVNISGGIHLLEGGHDHEHEYDHDHDRHHAKEHDEHNDPHVWLGPILAKKLAQNITQTLVQSFSSNKGSYEANLTSFLKELDQMDVQIAEKLKSIERNEFIVYHPSWAYLAKRYNLVQISVEIDGKEPKSKDLQNLIKLTKEKDIRVIFVRPGFPENSAKVLARGLNAQIVSINHLARNWGEELLKSIQALSSASQ